MYKIKFIYNNKYQAFKKRKNIGVKKTKEMYKAWLRSIYIKINKIRNKRKMFFNSSTKSNKRLYYQYYWSSNIKILKFHFSLNYIYFQTS